MALFTGIEHFSIAAHDTEALASWYGRVLGFRTRTTFDNGPGNPKAYMIELGQGGVMIEIIPADREKALSKKANTDPGMTHVAISVSDFDAAVRHLEAAGAFPDGAERIAPNGTRVRFYRDPEGNLFHILFRTQPL